MIFLAFKNKKQMANENQPIAKVTFASMSAFQSDDVALLNIIPPFITVANANGDNAWVSELKKQLEKMYDSTRGVKATVTISETNSGSGIIQIDPDDKPAYEVNYTLSRGISQF